MAKAVSELEPQARTLYDRLRELCPSDYLKYLPQNPLGQAWHDAVHGMFGAILGLEALGEELRDRAGLPHPEESTEPSPPFG